MLPFSWSQNCNGGQAISFFSFSEATSAALPHSSAPHPRWATSFEGKVSESGPRVDQKGKRMVANKQTDKQKTERIPNVCLFSGS